MERQDRPEPPARDRPPSAADVVGHDPVDREARSGRRRRRDGPGRGARRSPPGDARDAAPRLGRGRRRGREPRDLGDRSGAGSSGRPGGATRARRGGLRGVDAIAPDGRRRGARPAGRPGRGRSRPRAGRGSGAPRHGPALAAQRPRAASVRSSSARPSARRRPRAARLGRRLGRDRVEEEDRRPGCRPRRSSTRLVEGRDAQAVGAGRLERPGDRDGAVPVGVGLDDRLDPDAGRDRGAERARLPRSAVEVDLEPGGPRQRRAGRRGELDPRSRRREPGHDPRDGGDARRPLGAEPEPRAGAPALATGRGQALAGERELGAAGPTASRPASPSRSRTASPATPWR